MPSRHPPLTTHSTTFIAKSIGCFMNTLGDFAYQHSAERFPPFAPTNGISGEGPNIDISETDDAYEITADLPGRRSTGRRYLACRQHARHQGRKRTNHEEKKKDYRLIERSFGSFERMIPVPFNADPDAIKAVFEKGVLTITLVKPPEAKDRVKKIPLSAD